MTGRPESHSTGIPERIEITMTRRRPATARSASSVSIDITAREDSDGEKDEVP